MNKIIAIDTDDVKAPWRQSYIDFTNAKYGTDFKLEDMNHWNFSTKSPEIVRKAAEKGLPQNWFSESYLDQILKHGLADLPLIPGVSYGINFLLQEGWSIYAVTDRVTSLSKPNMISIMNSLPDSELEKRRIAHQVQEDTLIWYATRFERGIFTPKNVKFTNGEQKSEICRAIGASILVEDSYSNAVDFARSNPIGHTRNFSLLLDKNYNQGPEIPGLVRILGKGESQYHTLLDVIMALSEKFPTS